MANRINVDAGAQPWQQHTEFIETIVGDMVFQTPIDVLTPQPRTGVQHRLHPAGMMIYMYYGRPGRYFDEHGKEVAAEAARQAGFPVDEQLRQRRKEEAMTIAQTKIAEDFEKMGITEELLIQRGGYKIVRAGEGLFNILDVEDGSRYNVNGPIGESLARSVLDALVPPEEGDDKDSQDDGPGPDLDPGPVPVIKLAKK